MNPDKIRLLNKANELKPITSFADIGGVWNVEAGYTFYLLDNFLIDKAYLFDMNITDSVVNKASNYKNLKLVQGDFYNNFDKLDHVETIILFDFLLHQINPNWEKLLEFLSTQTNSFVIYNPQWIASKETIRLDELPEEEYLKNTPSNSHNGKDERVWQYGITNRDLTEKLEALGFELIYIENYGKFKGLENFENYGFIFVRK